MSTIIHLLIPKEFRVWCRPGQSPGDLAVTNVISKATCCNCLSRWRQKTTGRRTRIKAAVLDRPQKEREPQNRCIDCGRVIHGIETVCDKCYSKYTPMMLDEIGDDEP